MDEQVDKTQKMKIAVFTPSYPPRDGGIATVHYNLYHLLKEDYETRVFVFKDNCKLKRPDFYYSCTLGWFQKLVSFFIKLKFSKFKNEDLSDTTNVLTLFSSIWKLNKPLKEFNPDIIIVSDHYVPAYMIKKPKKSKLIWYSHHNYLRFRNNSFMGKENTTDNDIVRSLERKALKKADAVICPSEYMIREYERAYNHKAPIFLIRNFIDNQEIREINPSHISGIHGKGIPLIYIPSAGSAIKGKRYTFELVRRLSRHYQNNIGFYLSGYIPPDLQIELESVGNGHIIMPGVKNWTENIALVKTCNLGISAGLAENFSAAISEGFIYGIPFIAFDVGGNKELIKDGKTGYIVPFLNIEMLIEKSMYLLDNPGILNQFKTNSFEWAEDMFDRNRIKLEYKELFSKLIHG